MSARHRHPARSRPQVAVVLLLIFVLSLVGTLPIVVMLVWLGDPDLGQIGSGYLGVLLAGAMFLALGMLVSSFSGDQIVTFVVSTLLCFLFVLTGLDVVVSVLDGLFPGLDVGSALRDGFSVRPAYDAFVSGLIALPAVTYFVLFSAAFLWLNALVLERGRR